MRNIIFVAGIHGVGKTSFCKEISAQYNIKSFSASQLISSKTNIDYFENKKVSNIDENQNILIEAIKELRLHNNLFILEGHFCLLDKHGVISRIPKSTFFSLQIKGIIVLSAPIEIIYSRLKNRGTEVVSISFLKKFLEEEMIYSHEISNILDVPYIVHNDINPTKEGLEYFLHEIIKK
ncbi:ATP-binding protein [Paenibacillus ihuae]|uniref:ATP-binding protein n=1 Tax=Paenibacillus ihuae TaxID=1232431 RepID=UPI0006D59212|nr:ATP-binding protein [Paenibacillus ihuae]